MKKTNELLNKLLTITLTVVMVFSSVLVINTNTILAETNEEPETTEVETNEIVNEVIEEEKTTEVEELAQEQVANTKQGSSTQLKDLMNALYEYYLIARYFHLEGE